MNEKKLHPSSIEIRLTVNDRKRFDQYCVSRGVTKTDQAREAINYWLDHQDKQMNDARESQLDARLRKMEDRLAAMLMRNSIDVGVIYNAVYYNMGANADKAFSAFYSQSVKRLQAKRKDGQDKTAVMQLVRDLYRRNEPAQENVNEGEIPADAGGS